MNKARERQQRRTMEIISRFIGDKSEVNIEFNTEGKMCANPQTGTVKIPSNLKAKHLYPAIGAVIHEAGHVRKSTYKIEDFATDAATKNILNCIEDVRVDRYMYDLLPNIHSFQQKLNEWIDEAYEIDWDKLPSETKILISAMKYAHHQATHKIGSTSPEERQLAADIGTIIRSTCDDLDDYEIRPTPEGKKDINNNIKYIQDKLKLHKKQQQQKNSGGGGGGKGSEHGPKKPANRTQNPQADQDHGQEQVSASNNKDKDEDLDLERVKKQYNFGLTDSPVGGGSAYLGEAALRDQTSQHFKELLNEKTNKVTKCGTTLDSTALDAFALGDTDRLFTEDQITKKKKSKVLFLLDSSGSMGSLLLDGHWRNSGLASTVKQLTDILDDVHDIEGVNVDYDIRSFDTSYYKLSKDNWVKEYLRLGGGGTRLSYAFSKAITELVEDWTVDGNKMIVLVTDGQVDQIQIHRIKEEILRYNEDVRCMLLGIGADLDSKFIKEITPFNILETASADSVIMDAIMEML